MTNVYANLSIVPLDIMRHKGTCNYWYLVRNSHSAHTAFTKRASLLHWLEDRGLTFDETKLAPHEKGGSFEGPFPMWLPIIGTYREQAHMSYDEFYNLPNVVAERKAMSNGDYTMARITLDADGIRTVHTLNPNCKHRPVYDYLQCREEQG